MLVYVFTKDASIGEEYSLIFQTFEKAVLYATINNFYRQTDTVKNLLDYKTLNADDFGTEWFIDDKNFLKVRFTERQNDDRKVVKKQNDTIYLVSKSKPYSYANIKVMSAR